jgi:serine/threonine-protein kinase RsbW
MLDERLRRLMTDGTTSRLSLTLDSALPSIETIEENALEFARRAGFDEDDAGNVGMVAREAAVNAIVHGNQYDPGRHVTANFEASSSAVTIRIADEGTGFDADAIPDPLAAENLLRTSGRGVFLMRAFMDEVHFRQLSPGTEITLIKRRSA